MVEATARQCAVLVGASTGAVPLPLLPCGDRPFLAWLLREWMRFAVTDFVLLMEDRSELVRDALPGIRAGLPAAARIDVSEGPAGAGTGGALYHARGALDARFALCHGNRLFDTNLSALLAAGAPDGPEVLGRTLLLASPDASGTTDVGVCLLDRRVAEMAEPGSSLQWDVMPALASAGALRSTAASGYFLDLDVPDDLARARAELPARLHRCALFLDRDGVINVDHGWVGTRERWEWNGDSRAAIAAATQAGWHVFVVTNQSGVARGLYDEAAVVSLHGWMADEVRCAGGTIDAVRYCPHHPNGSVAAYARACDWRKPGAGMLRDLLTAWQVDPAGCVLIGDQPTDLEAAAAAGIAARRYEGGSLLAMVRDVITCGPTRTSAGGSDRPRRCRRRDNRRPECSNAAAPPHRPAPSRA